MKPKILYLITSSGWGGAERYVARLSAAAADEFDVTVMAGTSKRFELFQALPGSVHRREFPELKHPIAPFSDLAAIQKLRKFLGFHFFHVFVPKSPEFVPKIAVNNRNNK